MIPIKGAMSIHIYAYIYIYTYILNLNQHTMCSIGIYKASQKGQWDMFQLYKLL